MPDDYADDGLDWYRNLVGQQGPYANVSAGAAGSMPGSMNRPAASGQGPYMGYPAQNNAMANRPNTPGGGFSISQLLGISPANAEELPPGFQRGTYDPATGQWHDAPGMTLNNSGPRPITTPNSSTGAPISEFAMPQGGPLTVTPNSRTGAPAPGIRGLPATRMPRPGLLNLLPETPSASETESTLNAPPGLPTLRDIRNSILGEPGTRTILNPNGGLSTETAPTTQAQPQAKLAPPVPPGPPPPPVDTASPPPINIPPFNVPPPPPQPPPRGVPIPPQPTFHSGGRRGSGAPIGAMADPSITGAAAAPSPGEYFATTGNARGASWTPGGFASPPAQHFQTPLTPMFGPGQWIGGAAAAPTAAPGTGGRGAQSPGYNVNGMFRYLNNDLSPNYGGGAATPAQQGPAMRQASRRAKQPPDVSPFLYGT
jgi:hypothetical protein